jgi:pyridoxal phosphate-dependent aminotransferase EpsN
LEVIDERVSQRRSNYAFYYKVMSTLPGLSFQNEPQGSYSNRWLTAITIDPQLAKTSNEEVRQHLELLNIEARPVWKPMHLQPVYKDTAYFGGKIAENLFKNGLCLPSGSQLDSKDRLRIYHAIQQKLDL